MVEERRIISIPAKDRKPSRRADLEARILRLTKELINTQQRKETWKPIATDLLNHLEYLYQYTKDVQIKELRTRIEALRNEIARDIGG